MNFNCAYSLGVDCLSELALVSLKLKQFSSVIGSINCKTVANVNFSVQDNFNTLLNPSFHRYVNKESNTFVEELEKKSARTFHTKFDNIDNFSDATFQHHDLSVANTQQHFKNAVAYFNAINKASISTLYVCMACRTINTPIEDCLALSNTLQKLNPNSHVLILNLQDNKKNLNELSLPYYTDSKCTIYLDMHNKAQKDNVYKLKELVKLHTFNSLITREDVLKLI